MSARDARHERSTTTSTATVSDWLHEDAGHRVPDHLDEVLRRTPHASASGRHGRASKGGSPCNDAPFRARAQGRLAARGSRAPRRRSACAVLTRGSRSRQPAPAVRARPQRPDRLRQGGRHLPLRSGDGRWRPRWSPARRATRRPLFSPDGSRLLFSRGPTTGSPAPYSSPTPRPMVMNLRGGDSCGTWSRLVASGDGFGASAGPRRIHAWDHDRECRRVDRPRSNRGIRRRSRHGVGPTGPLLFTGAFRRKRSRARSSPRRRVSHRQRSCTPRDRRRGASTILSVLDGTAVSLIVRGTARHRRATPVWDGDSGRMHVLDLATGAGLGDPGPADPLTDRPVDDVAGCSPDGTRCPLRAIHDGSRQIASRPSAGRVLGHRVGVALRQLRPAMCPTQFSPDGTRWWCISTGPLDRGSSARPGRARGRSFLRPAATALSHAAPGALTDRSWRPARPSVSRPSPARPVGTIAAMAHRVTLIPGDGIGPELAEATRRVLDATGVDVRVGRPGGGRGRMAEHGTPAARSRPRVDPPQPGRAEGPDHHAGRHGLPQRQRRPPPGARPLRQPAPGTLYAGPRDPLRGRRPRDRPREHRGPLRRHRAHGRPRRRREHQDHHPRALGADRRASPSTTPSPTAARRSRRSTRRTS